MSTEKLIQAIKGWILFLALDVGAMALIARLPKVFRYLGFAFLGLIGLACLIIALVLNGQFGDRVGFKATNNKISLKPSPKEVLASVAMALAGVVCVVILRRMILTMWLDWPLTFAAVVAIAYGGLTLIFDLRRVRLEKKKGG